jgi:PAS domain S-box-containing protein
MMAAMAQINNHRNAHASDYLISVFESSPLALIVLDTRLRIIMFNRAAQVLTGFGAFDVIGRRINTVIRFERLREIISTLRRKDELALDGYITKLMSRRGADVPVRLRISRLVGRSDALLGLLIIAADLREIKRLQAKLLEAERLAAITETVIGINHEINNPLCSILGNTQLLLMDKERFDSKTVSKLKIIEREIARISQIADRLSRIKKPVLKEYVDGKQMLDVEHSSVDDSTGDELT